MPILNVVIDVDGEEGITTQDVEEALNYYFGIDFVVSVKEAAQQSVQADTPTGDGIKCPICGEVDYCIHRDN